MWGLWACEVDKAKSYENAECDYLVIYLSFERKYRRITIDVAILFVNDVFDIFPLFHCGIFVDDWTSVLALQ